MNDKQLTMVLPVVYKYANTAAVWMWKLGLGKFVNLFPSAFGRKLVVDFSRREAKAPSQMPMTYIVEGDQLYCTAFMSANPDWPMSVTANSQVEVWMPDGWYAGKAELVQDEEERARILPKLQMSGGWAAKMWERMQDGPQGDGKQLPILRIQRQSACTGAEGPGGMAWLWPFILLFFLFRPRRKR
ncbi:MAG: hypothetical protein PWQ55_146 [Chloroflexota bacterium]|nr:hypothetical protein [Chloroflexota bacterium]